MGEATGDIYGWYHKSSRAVQRRIGKVKWTPEAIEAIGAFSKGGALPAQLRRDASCMYALWDSAAMLEGAIIRGHFPEWNAEVWSRKVIEYLELQVANG